MKKLSALIVLSASLLAIESSTALGGVQVNDRVVFTNVHGANQGMWASIYTSAGVAPANFKGKFVTFCVEGGNYSSGIEYVNPDQTYYKVGSLTDNVAWETKNVITDGAKWLYRQYLDGTLSSFNGSAADMGALQRAIWSLTTLSDNVTFLVTLGASETKAKLYRKLVTDPVSSGGAGIGQYQVTSGAYGIGVMNPHRIDTKTGAVVAKNVQSFLYEVPEPAAVIAWSVLGLVGVGLIRRSRRAK